MTEYFLIAEKQGQSSQNVLLQKILPTFFVHDGSKFNSRGATTSIVAFQMSQKSTFQFQHFKDFSIIIRVSYMRKSLVGEGDFLYKPLPLANISESVKGDVSKNPDFYP